MAKQEFVIEGLSNKIFCVTLIDFLPLIKGVPQFLIKGKFFLERERYMSRKGLKVGQGMLDFVEDLS